MRVALADDSTLFRDGIALLLDHASIEVTVSARTGEELLARIASDPPDVVITDLRMPPTYTDEGLAIAERARELCPDIAVLLLSAYIDSSHAVRLLAGHAHGLGLLSKDRVADLPTLVDALNRLHEGGTVLDEQVIAELFEQRTRTQGLAALTVRERQVLALMAEGRANASIGSMLHLSERTIEAYNAVIFDKLGIPATREDNRRVLAVLAWLRGEHPPSEPGPPRNQHG